jgi:O-antigen/teichoic acid export membrane protein
MKTGILYAKAVGSGIVSKAVSGLSGLAIIWLLNAALGKADFGHCMVAFSISTVVSLMLASGFRHVLIYRVARLDTEKDGPRSRVFAGAALLTSLVLAIAAMAGMIAGADLIAGLLGKPETAPWLKLFAVLVPLSVTNTVLTGWYQARQLIPTSVFFSEMVPDAFRVLLLAVAWLVAGRELEIAGALALAMLMPTVWLYGLDPVKPRMPMGVFAGWDLRYGLTLMLSRLADQRFQSVNVVLLGALSTAEATADFVVAIRMALLLGVLQQLLSQLQLPRLGMLMARGGGKRLSHEYDATRFIALLAAIAGSIAFLVLGPFVLPWFGGYDSAYPLLLLLSAAMVLRAGFGSSGNYLIMSGYGLWRLMDSIIGLVSTVIFSYALVPSLGAEGAALAAFASVFVTKIMDAVVIWRYDRVATVDAELIVAMSGLVVALFGAGFGLISPLWASLALSAIGVWMVLKHRRMWRPWVAGALGRRGAS